MTDGRTIYLGLYKLSRELARHLPPYRGEMVEYHSEYPVGSASAIRERDAQRLASELDIVYFDVDNDAIAKYHRQTGELSLSDDNDLVFGRFPNSFFRML